MTTGSPILQSGNITPAHLVSWTTDGVVQDAGVAIAATYGVFNAVISGVNFSLFNTDFPISLPLPTGFTRYRIHDIIISGASASLASATCGVFTQAGGLGQAIVTGSTAVTITATAADTINNMQVLTINNQNIVAWSDTTIYFRVQTNLGTFQTASVTVNYEPLP